VVPDSFRDGGLKNATQIPMQEGALPVRLPASAAAVALVARAMDALPGLVLESTVQFEVRDCLALSRTVEAQVSTGERLIAARAVVALVRAYDRVLDNIRLTPLSVEEQQSMRDRLGPVTQLLRRYRMR
jgi:hypothetical protein